MKKYWTSYYWATLFFPSSQRDDVIELYKFVRIPDLVVDDKNFSNKNKQEKIVNMYQSFEKDYKSKNLSWEREWIIKLDEKYNFWFSKLKKFWDAMILDTKKSRYENYEDLKNYMDGSAMVVWEMMCDIMWTDEYFWARQLGEAMQLTNFLRDVKEDFLDLWRIYMPLDELKKFDLNYQDIEQFCQTGEYSNSWSRFCDFQIDKTRLLYSKANRAIKNLPKSYQKSILLSSKLYESILDKIEKNNFDVFSKDAHTTKYEKLKIILKNI